MRSEKLGRATSDVEVTNVSPHGFWLLLGGEEQFVPFADFPWFRTSTIGALMNVVLAAPGHLHWPELDIDLAVDSIAHPERYPLVSHVADPNAANVGYSSHSRKATPKKRQKNG